MRTRALLAFGLTFWIGVSLLRAPAPVDAGEVVSPTAAAQQAPAETTIRMAEVDVGETPVHLRLISALGLAVIIGLGVLMSRDRRHIDWRLQFWGLSLQFVFALLIFRSLWMGLGGLALLVFINDAWRRDPSIPRWSTRATRIRLGVVLATPLVLGVLFLLIPEEGWGSYGRDALFGSPIGKRAFGVLNDVVNKLLSFTDVGTGFLVTSHVTGDWPPALKNLLFAVLPTIIFFSSLMTVLYHLGVMQVVVRGMASLMYRTMGTSGAESMSAAANIFVGQTEAPLVVKPYVKDMTQSELMSIMTGGFATVAGGVLAAYVAMLSRSFPDIAGHMIAASVMSAPAALAIAKLMVPERQESRTRGGIKMEMERPDANLIGAAARGASEGMTLYLNVVAMLLAFIALIAMLNWIIGLYGMSFQSWGSFGGLIVTTLAVGGLFYWVSEKPAKTKQLIMAGLGVFLVASLGVQLIVGGEALKLTLESIVGACLSPIAFLMGIPWEDAAAVGRLLGEKLILNEFIAYTSLAEIMRDPATRISPRAFTIAAYALLGFANFGSIGIQIGGIGGIAPERRTDLVRLGFQAMVAGTLAAYATACVAGILL